ncbi:amino acid ABC transporter permease [Desulfovibrio sp.]|uniref:amino acid ABC transporter permease n=1 Tax=Desulfovibrio sp. TaxID=885 RepID=UPI002A36E3D2|nr:amino acid ABC transporter permease [Desulfovibrio sp.]MDY0258147.1 amino acid ABC transporter permease [Desulfovibrio sp.]
MLQQSLEWCLTQLKALGLNYSFVLDMIDREAFMRGMLVTVELSICIIPLSLLVGVLMSMALTSRHKWLMLPVRAFVEFTRNTPALVQLYFAFLVLNMLLTQYAGIPGNIIPSFAWAVFVIALHKGAINAEALRAGLDAISPNIIEAARASALNPWQSMIYVRLPLAFRFALPALINNLVDLVKMTTLASAIGVGDVTYESVMIWGQRDNALELLLLILVFYMLLTLTVSFCGKWLEQKLRMPGYGQ